MCSVIQRNFSQIAENKTSRETTTIYLAAADKAIEITNNGNFALL